MKYFIGNWKMFGIPGSIKIIDRINNFLSRDKKNNKKYKVIIAPPHTLLQDFSRKFKNKKISICAQNCFYKDYFGAYTGSVSPFMIKKIGVKYVIIGHSENRTAGETDSIIKQKVLLALKNNFTVIFCIGENKKEKANKKTVSKLHAQLEKVLDKKMNFRKIIIAYEPIWSIGSGNIPKDFELADIALRIKIKLAKIYKKKVNIPVLYGGSVDGSSIEKFNHISTLDGFLIGGASKSSKNFIDIIKNFYK